MHRVHAEGNRIGGEDAKNIQECPPSWVALNVKETQISPREEHA